MSRLPNLTSPDGSDDMSEKFLRNLKKVVSELSRQYSCSDGISPSKHSFLAPLAVFYASENTIVSLNASEFCELSKSLVADEKSIPGEVKNMLNVMYFYGYGTYYLNIIDGEPDWQHAIIHVKRKANSKAPLFVRPPTSAQFCDMQKDLILLLCHIPFMNGRIEVSYHDGIPSAIHYDITDYIRLESS